jgi:hypothetical protein
MAQGAAIFAKEEASRHWTNAPIPESKMYDDPAYKPKNANSNTNSNANSQNGGKYKHRKTQKKNRNAKKTRKH